MKILKGDLFKSSCRVICHQVNCLGVMGGGIALTIRYKYPNVYQEYKILCDNHTDKRELLGKCQIVRATQDRVVANLFGQLGFGYNIVQTDYEALRSSLHSLNQQLQKMEYDGSVGFPYKMSCCRGGGDWTIVKSIIESEITYPTIIYQLD